MFAGWIGNAVDAAFEERDACMDLLRAGLPAPCVGLLPRGAAARAMAECIDVARLIDDLAKV